MRSKRFKGILLSILIIASLTALAISTTSLPSASLTSAQLNPENIAIIHSIENENVYHITLITGDVVIVSDMAGGQRTLQIIPADSRSGLAFQTFKGPDGTYVFPSGADLNKLDKEFFNIDYLIEQGYCEMEYLPVIIGTASITGRVSRAESIQDIEKSARTLYSIEAEIKDFNGEVTMNSPRLSILAAKLPVDNVKGSTEMLLGRPDVEKIWLDKKVQVSLNESVPLIGAPELWAAGDNGAGIRIAILDTGIDATHPDLDDLDDNVETYDPKVTVAVNFTDDGSADDLFGHGTHCAGIAAGTGEASNYLYRGVAPGAYLWNIKVLNRYGSGYESWIISGIQYAALGPDGVENTGDEADVISMSFGANINGDGTDSISTAVDWATDQGVVCVAAAGNSGPNMFTVGMPAVARKVITVGATTKTDDMIYFSSWGPTADFRLKPDVVAPGVDIIAPRASGTSMGSPIDDYYTRASGTSMSTPHVAGAAALLLRAHPDWSPIMIKSALMGNAKVLENVHLWEQGAGRIQVPEAENTGLMAVEPSLSFGMLSSGENKVATLTLINLTDSPENVNISTCTKCDNVETDYVSVNPASMTIGAHENAEVIVQVGPLDENAPEGWYEGWINMTYDQGTLKVPLLFAALARVSVDIYDLDNSKISAGIVLAEYPSMAFVSNAWGTTAQFYVKGGNYAVLTQSAWIEKIGYWPYDWQRMFMIERAITVPKLSEVHVSISLAEALVSEIPMVDNAGKNLVTHAYIQYFSGNPYYNGDVGVTMMNWSMGGGWSGYDINVPKLTFYSSEFDPPENLSQAFGFYASDNLLSEVYLLNWKYRGVQYLPPTITHSYPDLAKYDFYYDMPETYPEKGLNSMNAFWFTWENMGGFQFWGGDVHKVPAGMSAKYYLAPLNATYWGYYMPTYGGWNDYNLGPIQEWYVGQHYPYPQIPPEEGEIGNRVLGDFQFAPYAPGLSLDMIFGSKNEVIYPSADAEVDSATPDTPSHGTAYNMYNGWSPTYGSERNYLQFDLSKIPSGATIDSAVLMLNSKYGPSTGVSPYPPTWHLVDARPVNNDDWSEWTITWNNAPQPENTVLDTENFQADDYVGAFAWCSWDVTSFVSSQIAGGDKTISIALRGQNEGLYNSAGWFYSKDAVGSNNYWPRLQVSYTVTSYAINITGDIWKNLTWPHWQWWGGSGPLSPYPQYPKPYYSLYVDNLLVASGIFGRTGIDESLGIWWDDIKNSWNVMGQKGRLEIHMPSLATVSKWSTYELSFDLADDVHIPPIFDGIVMPLSYSSDENITIQLETPIGIENIILEYSFDNGASWETAGETAQGYLIPCEVADGLTIRISATDQWGNSLVYTSGPASLAEKVVLSVPEQVLARPGETVEISGNIATLEGKGLEDLAVALSDNNNITYASSNENGVFTFTCTAPPEIGEYDFSIISPSVGVYQSSEAPVRLIVKYFPKVSISPSEQKGLLGELLTYVVTVTNTGTFEDNYNLTISDSAGWDLTLSDNLLDNVQPSENRTATLIVAIPENATPGTRDNITITATSTENAEVSGSAACIAQVLPGILIVADDDASSWIRGTSLPEFESALTAAGYDYFVWKESTMGHPSLEFLTMFKLVIWTCGGYWSWAVDSTDAETLEAYLAQGGNIFLEGEDIGYNHHADNFMVNVAHAIYQVDDTGAPGLTVTDPSHPVTRGLPTTFSWLQNPPYDDGVTPTNGGFEVIQYTGTPWTAVTVFDGGATGYGSVIYYAFPIYCLWQSERDMLVINSANWIMRPVHVSILPRYQEGLPGATLEYTVTVINRSTLEDTYDLAVNDDLSWALTLSENQLENVLPGERRTGTLGVTIPENATPGNEDKITVTAISAENTEISDSSTCIAHAVMARLSPPHSDYGLDTDNDNLYNYLVVEAKVAVATPGWYEVYGSLRDNEGNWITSAWADNYLEVGIQTLELRFKGYEIERSGRDGPYHVYLDLYSWDYGWIDSGEHETEAYTHDQFQPPPANLFPPHSDYGLDTDNDNLYNYLVVEVGVEVEKAGRYQVSSSLYDNAYNYITGAWAGSYLDVGIQTIELRFYGGRINSSGRDGPYRVYLSLYDNEGNWLDSGEHETTAYSHDQFQPPPFTIYIENDDFFTPGNGVNGDGSGTVDNPYIIENWVIDASCVHGIWIRNTTKYFIIRNCLVENGGDSYYGICLENVVNGKIENNTVGNNFSGIQFEYSDNNIISNNIMRKNLANGVRLDYSHNNLIENNIAENNGDDGIELGESENNFILNNVAENNRYNGVVIWNSDYNIIENNLLENNYYGIYFAYGSDNNLIENNTCSNNSSNGIELDSYSDNNTISGNICSNNYYFGISLFDSSNNVISNNIAENTRNIHGIILDHSDNNLIENNTVRNNQQSGIQIHLSSNNTISNNIVEDSRTYEGILIQDSNNNLIENNLVENNQTYGIDLYEDSDNNIISGNICSNNLYDGIVLFSSDRNLISNNTCKNNDDDGIDLNSSSNNTIDNNLVENNYYQEIRLEWSPNNTIFNNIVENTRSECGIFIWGSDNNLIENNTTKNNNISGIYLNYSNNNLIKNNIGENDRQSIELYNYSDNNRIENNIAENNRQFGIILNNSSNNALSSNTCSNNLYDGIVLYSSNNNLISNNTCKNNGRDGIDLYYIYSGGYIGSDNNTLDNNTCSNNSCGIYLSDSDINTITNNTCSSNNSCGIYLRYSLNNRIFHNNFVNNAQQARDGDTNYWDNGYPSGGNYWSDYTGVDNYQGENQDIPGSDGIGDMPYYISGGGNRDRYPLVVVAPILVWPASCENINDNTPTFVWTSVTDQSGVTYQIQIDDSPDFSSPVYFAIDLTENTHTLPDENALALFVQYFWRIRAVDGVGNASDWSGEWNFTVTTSVTFTFNLWKGWNMISFPVMPDNKDPHSIFPGDYTMFRWDAENKRYVLCTDENIENGVGYWVYVSAAENVVVSGTPVDSLTLPLSAGWNLIGSPLGGASIANPNDTPDNSVLPYAFTWDAENRRYTPPITDLVAGAGYWVYALDNCVLKQPGEIWVAIVTDIRGRGDMSFNDMGFKGCDLALEQGIVDKVTEVISTTPEDYLPNLRALASSGDYDLIIPIGYLLQGATYTVAKEYPQQNFACIDFNSDSGYPDYTPMGTLGALGVLFREEQSGAIEGVIAALIAAQYSKPQVGIVLGMEIPPVIAYEIGFRYGLYWGLSWYENKFGTTAPGIGATSTKIIYQYTDAFDNPALGKTTAQAQLAHDLAVCWGVAGQTGLGVFDAVEEYHNDHSIPIAQPPFIMGVDADQDWMKPGLVISSAMKRIDQAVVRICQLVRDNEFKSTVETTGGILRLGMTEGAAGASTLAMLDDLGVSENIKATVMAMRNAQPAWVWEGASALENKILSGEITILRVTDHDTAETYRTLWA